MFPDSKNVTFIQIPCWPNFIPYQPSYPVLLVLKIGQHTNWIKVTFLDSPGSIEYCYVFGFRRSSGSLLTNFSKTPWGITWYLCETHFWIITYYISGYSSWCIVGICRVLTTHNCFEDQLICKVVRESEQDLSWCKMILKKSLSFPLM